MAYKFGGMRFTFFILRSLVSCDFLLKPHIESIYSSQKLSSFFAVVKVSISNILVGKLDDVIFFSPDNFKFIPKDLQMVALMNSLFIHCWDNFFVLSV